MHCGGFGFRVGWAVSDVTMGMDVKLCAEPEIKSLWLAENPSKRWGEIFFLAYSPFWIITLLGVVVPLRLYEACWIITPLEELPHFGKSEHCLLAEQILGISGYQELAPRRRQLHFNANLMSFADPELRKSYVDHAILGSSYCIMSPPPYAFYVTRMFPSREECRDYVLQIAYCRFHLMGLKGRHNSPADIIC